MKDLVCLVADKNMEATVGALLERPEALHTRPVQADIWVHPRRDPGCFREAPDFLRDQRTSYSHALVVLDRAWDGASDDAAAMKASLRERLGGDGWSDVVVIEPELEVWVWSDSPHVDRCLGWEEREVRIRPWLERQGLWLADVTKPPDPKRAVEMGLREVGRPRSSEKLDVGEHVQGHVDDDRWPVRLRRASRRLDGLPQPLIELERRLNGTGRNRA